MTSVPAPELVNYRVSSRVPELDGLRGVAILLVVLFHYFYFYPSADHRPADVLRSVYVHFERCIALGWTGVDLFFVLSGFLIGGILLDVKSSPFYFKTFYLRRFYRIVPLYYGWILSYLLFVTFTSAVFRAQGVQPEGPYQMFALFLFLQNFGLGYRSLISSAWFAALWSLAVEEQFYLVSPFLIRFLPKSRLLAVIFIAVASAPLFRIWFHFHVHIPKSGVSLAYTLMPCRADALAIGTLAATLWRNSAVRVWLSRHCSLVYGLALVFLAGVIALGRWSPDASSLATESVGYTWIAVFYALILLLALLHPGGPVASIARLSWLREIGRVSYCLYIIHIVVRLGCESMVKAVLHDTQPWHAIATGGMAAILAYLIARASWVYFEHPLLQKGHTHKY